MGMGIEKKFFTKEEVENLMRNSDEVRNTLKNSENEEILWLILPKGIADVINAKRIEEDNIDVYKKVDEIINASNQHFWAYAATNPNSQLQIIIEYTGKIAPILWDTEISFLEGHAQERYSQEFMKKSLELGERAVKNKQFKDEEIKYILSSYIRRGLRTGEGGYEKPLLKKFLESMFKNKEFYETLDFFDEHLLDGHFKHPFPQVSATLDEPFMVKRSFLLDIESEIRGDNFWNIENKDEKIRLNKTVANFYLHGKEDMEGLGGLNAPTIYSYSFFYDEIKERISNVKYLIELEGLSFINFLKEQGFEEGVRNIYIWDYERETGKKLGTSSYSERENVEDIIDKTFSEIDEALKVLGLKELPKDKKIAQGNYRDIIRLWHPDYCDLPEAHENAVKAINAWEIIKGCYE